MQRKLAVAMALLHAPDLLVLDEPTTGVDPVSRAELWRLISAAAADGTAVAVSTTYVNEAARAALVVLLEAGRTAASGTPAQILNGFPGRARRHGRRRAPGPAVLAARRHLAGMGAGGLLPAGARPVAPDFEDAVVAAALAGQRSGHIRVSSKASSQDRRDDAVEYLAETRGALRRFGRFTAVSGVDLTVRPGEILGLLGANGAGKTTLIRLLLGLLPPNEGVIHLFGETPSIATRRRVGYVPQTLGLYAGLTVQENWDFTAAAFGSRRPAAARGHRRVAAATGRQPAARRAAPGGVRGRPLPPPRAPGARRAHVGRRPARQRTALGGDQAGRGRGCGRAGDNPQHGGSRAVRPADDHGGREGRGVGHRQTTSRQAGTSPRSAPRDWSRAFALLDDGGFPVQLHGTMLRSGGQPAEISALLSRAGIDAAVASVPANLEEAFVAIVAGPAAR